MSFLRNITIKLKIFLLVAVFAVGFLIYGGIAYFTLNSYKINSTTYHKIEREMNFASDMEPPHLWLQQAYFVTSRIQNEPDQEHAREMVEDLKKTKVNYEESFAKWKKDLAEGEVKDLIVNKIDKPARDFFETVEKEFIPAVLSGDAKKIASLNVTVLEKDYKEQTKYIEQAIELNRAQNGQDESEVASAINFWSAFLVIIAFVITGLVCFLGWFITRIISEPLNQVVDKITAISEGDTNQTFDYQSNDEIGKLASVFRSLNSYIREVAGSVEALGNGNLNAKITVRSEKDLLSRNVTRSIESLQQIMTETNQLIQAAQEGNLSLRGDTTKYQGAYSQLVGGINKMMDTVAMPITEAVDVLEKISNRDLTVHMNGDYKGDFAKIKNSLNQATDNLDEGFKQIAVSSEQVASAATQISAGSQNLAQSASEQASTLEEVSSNIQEISSMSRQNESNSKEARSLSDDARNITRRGMKSMQKLSEAVERIKTSSDSTAKIVKTIEEIAFQTNLLALNAAVEAARAGDAGKGFAVVAEEVRNLAMRSAEAAKTTAQLIDEAVTNTNEGVSLNTEVLQNFEEINGQIEKVSIVISEIAAASEQQNQGVAQINSAVEQMNGVTQQAAANSEESASAAEELSSQSQEMLGLIESYKLSGNSTTGKTFGRQQSHHAFQKAVVNLKTSSALTHHPLSKPLKSKKNGNSPEFDGRAGEFHPFR